MIRPGRTPIAAGTTTDPATASLRQGDSKLEYAYRCPLHDTDRVAPYTPALARQFIAATADHLCCCPGGAPWSVRRGLVRTPLLSWLLATLWLANLCDLLLTTRAVALGRATEANGLMSYFLHVGSLTAGVFKVGLVTLAVVALWRLRRRGVVLWVAAALTIVLVAVVCYEALSLFAG
jgi:hypothetical protein